MQLAKIKPFHPPEGSVPPPGAVPHGMTDDQDPAKRKQLFRRVTKRSKGVPLLDGPATEQCGEAHVWDYDKGEPFVCMVCGAPGKQRWRKNANTGEPMYPLNKPLNYDLEEIFYLESHGNGNVGMTPFQPKSEDEKERGRLAAAAKELGGGKIGEVLAKRGISADQLADFIQSDMVPGEEEHATTSTTSVDEEPVEEVVEEADTYPLKRGSGWWAFSDGEKDRCTYEEALEYEQALTDEDRQRYADAQAEAESTPEI